MSDVLKTKAPALNPLSDIRRQYSPTESDLHLSDQYPQHADSRQAHTVLLFQPENIPGM